MDGLHKITPDEFREFAEYIKSITGNHLDNSKTYLLESRFYKLMTTHNCKNFRELLQKSRSDRLIESEIIDMVTTHESSFFRDANCWKLFQHKILPDMIDQKEETKRWPVRIWSAACSYGQEPTTLAIATRTMCPVNTAQKFQILASDISDDVIKKASMGVYTQFEVRRGLTPEQLRANFTQNGPDWKVKDEVRAMIRYQRFNLMDNFAGLGFHDIIFCRYALIYFTPEDKKELIRKFHRQLNPNGVLIIGGTEAVDGCDDIFEKRIHMNSVYYVKKR